MNHRTYGTSVLTAILHPRRLLLPFPLLLLLASLVAAGCARSEAPDKATAPQGAAATQQTPAQSGSTPSDPLAAEITRWEATVAKEPTADNWSELSYANIKAGRWEAAAEAGYKALKLKHDHPYALYNTGLALVKMEKAMEALPHLKQTAALQPDRHEPPMVLAQAYRQLGHYLLGSHYARRAISLAKGDPEALQTEKSVAAMLTAKPPADLSTACVERIADGGFSLCLYQEPAPKQTVDRVGSAYTGNRYTLWYGPAGQPPRPLPLGYIGDGKFVPTALPGGVTGYWLPGGWVGAGVANTHEWRLFIREGSALRQVLFLGGDHYEGGSVSDFMRSPYTPRNDGDQIVTGHRDDFSGSRTMKTTRRLSLAEGTVRVVLEEEIISGPLKQLTPQIEVESGYGYRWAYPLATEARITLNGQAAKLADLTLGMYATITVREGQIIALSAKKL